MANVAITTFNGGEFSDMLDARSDTEKYSSGCRVMENMFPTVFGAATRRPGRAFIQASKNSSANVRMIPFIYSAEISYMLEFGAGYIRVFYDGDPLEVGGAQVEVATPYLAADLAAIQYTQIGDVMWLVHGDHPPAKLSRETATHFAYDVISFRGGPFLTRNDLAGYNDSDGPDGVTMTLDEFHVGDTGTMTASAARFSAEYVGALFKLRIPRNSTNVTYTSTASGDTGYSSPIDVKGNWTFKVTGGSNATIAIDRQVGDGDWDQYRSYVIVGGVGNPNVSFTEEDDDVRYRIHFVDIGSTAASATIEVETSYVDGVVEITSYTSPTVVGIEVISALHYSHPDPHFITGASQASDVAVLSRRTGFSVADDVVITGVEGMTQLNGTFAIKTMTGVGDATGFTLENDSRAWGAFTAGTVKGLAAVYDAETDLTTKRWWEGAWSNEEGFPRAVAAYEGRIVYGGSKKNEQTLWFSASDDYPNFAEGVNDDDAFVLRLTTTNEIRWIEGLDSLCIGTSGDEWAIISSKLTAPLTPTNFSARLQSTHGSAEIQPVRVGNAILYVDYVGRKVREMAYSVEKDKYVSPDLTQFAEHIALGGITAIAFQKNPEPTLWCVREDGELLSLAYDRDQNVVAWSHHPGGESVSVACMPSDEEDEVWCATTRAVDGSDVTYIEQFQPRDWGTDDDLAYFVDSGITYDGVSTTTIPVAHLEGETVAVYSGGAVQPSQVVSGGSITLPEAATYAIVGLPYTYILEPMRIDINSKSGSSMGSKTKIAELAISFYKTLGVEIGVSTDELKPIDWRTTENYDTATAFKTGWEIINFYSDYTLDQPIVLSGSAPLPCTVRAIVAKIEVPGR